MIAIIGGCLWSVFWLCGHRSCSLSLSHTHISSTPPTTQAIAHPGFSLINIAIDPLCGTESGSLQDHN